MPSKNGNHKDYPYEFVCHDSGIVLHIRKCPFTVTSQLHAQYEKEFKPPEPPYAWVDYGSNEKGEPERIKEPNYSHPTYLALLQKYEAAKATWVNERAMHVFTDYAIQCEVDKEAVSQLRETMKTQGVELDPDDKFVYIWNIAVGTGDGYGELFAAIQRRSQVTPEAISDTLNRFPNPIPAA